MQTSTITLDEKHEITLADEERQPCEVWTRVMGYFRPVAAFNCGKQGEHQERKCFREPASR
jgi:anaerobic ribonucleoside-triphosphate reductase